MLNKNLNTALGRLSFIGIFEGISFLVLLCIAMPLKYYFDMPIMVKYVGWAHGLLFVLYLAAVLNAWISYKWPFKIAFAAGIASVIPFGPFIFDSKLKKIQAENNPINI